MLRNKSNFSVRIPFFLSMYLIWCYFFSAVGVGENTELSLEIYKRSDVYVESRDLAKSEIPHITITGELGELEIDVIKRPESTERITIFQSRGEQNVPIYMSWIPMINDLWMFNVKLRGIIDFFVITLVLWCHATWLISQRKLKT